MKIECENNFCIYFENYYCKLTSISLDRMGVCAECICVNIDEYTLNAKRKNLLEKYEQENC